MTLSSSATFWSTDSRGRRATGELSSERFVRPNGRESCATTPKNSAIRAQGGPVVTARVGHRGVRRWPRRLRWPPGGAGGHGRKRCLSSERRGLRRRARSPSAVRPWGSSCRRGCPTDRSARSPRAARGPVRAARAAASAIAIGSSDFLATFLWIRWTCGRASSGWSGSFASSRPRTHTRTSGCPYDAAMPSM
jgi:hypothetical protein